MTEIQQPADPRIPCGDEDEIDLLDLLIVFARNKFFIFGTAFLFALTAAGATFFMTPAYKAETIFLPATMNEDQRNPASFVVQVTKSTPVLSRIAETHSLQKIWQSESLMKTIKALNESISLKTDKDSSLITMTVEVSDPVLAADMANSIVEETQKQLFVLHQGQMEQVRRQKKLLETEIRELQEKFAAGENALSRLVDSSSLTAEEKKELSGGKRLEEGISPDTIKKFPNGGASYIEALRNLKTQEELYFAVLAQYSKVLEQEKAEPISLQILEKASVPEQRSRPRRTLIVVMACFLGGFIGIFGAFIREFARNAKNDPARKAKLEELSAAIKLFGTRKG
ncbi:Wzz/FepE/Etk N-terminal domain-containing protein [Aminivibrio sp.]|uniref:Wzz/FepE/Etk N-terminal domain-containing protein n=1 Tax=Aminivibrio sp. TaxID=1872489 RepID=UPI001A5BC093|nr:Wzz/FepE/Etk N-terminal domain-containing protein [Aminivibrio sp.]MBL3538079.1 hypothetical protein [Aminivibrio sp.]